MVSGVDGAVASTHKVLASLTQAAVLNIQESRVDPGPIATAVGLAQTTSPAATILASIDACRRQVALNGEALLGRAIELAGDARRRLQALPGVGVLDSQQLGINDFDLAKLVIGVHGLGLTGFEGDVISADKLNYLRVATASGMYLSGPSDPHLATILVVDGDEGLRTESCVFRVDLWTTRSFSALEKPPPLKVAT